MQVCPEGWLGIFLCTNLHSLITGQSEAWLLAAHHKTRFPPDRDGCGVEVEVPWPLIWSLQWFWLTPLPPRYQPPGWNLWDKRRPSWVIRVCVATSQVLNKPSLIKKRIPPLSCSQLIGHLQLASWAGQGMEVTLMTTWSCADYSVCTMEWLGRRIEGMNLPCES